MEDEAVNSPMKILMLVMKDKEADKDNSGRDPGLVMQMREYPSLEILYQMEVILYRLVDLLIR